MKGAIAEMAIQKAAVELGYVVLRPLVEGRRYDLVIDTGPDLHRVQCNWQRASAGDRRLRLAATANNQQVAVRYASDCEFPGAIAQLGERRTGSAKAGGSSPPSSTSNVRPLR